MRAKYQFFHRQKREPQKRFSFLFNNQINHPIICNCYSADQSARQLIEKQKWPLIVSRKFTIKGHSSCSLISNIFPNPLFLLSTPSTKYNSPLPHNTTLNGESTFDIRANASRGDGPVFSSKEFRIRLYINSFLSDSNFYCSHLQRSDFSQWKNFREKNNLLFHWFVPSFLCDLIISRFFRKSNWHSVWNFYVVFVQWVELCLKNKIGGLQVDVFVIY